MTTCAVYGCCNSSATTGDPTIQYFHFPKQQEIAQQWLQACSWPQNSIDLNTAKICCIHFTNDCFVNDYKILNHLNCYTKFLKHDAVPTLFLPVQTPAIFLNTDEYTQNSQITCMENTDIKFHPQESVKQENIALQKRVDCLKTEIDALRDTLHKTKCKYRDVDSDYSEMQKNYCSLQVSAMSLQQQKNLLAKVFSESQMKILMGKKKIYWSNDDMAMAYTIRHLSNKRCYAYLSKNLNIPLPALSSIKRWATVKKHECKVETEKM